MSEIRMLGDFNGLSGDYLCLTHGEPRHDENGNVIDLHEGMKVTAFEPDFDEQGDPDELFASGVVEPSPPALACRGSVWSLHIDENGVRHTSDLDGDESQ